jgi:hypothetical protein
MDWISSLRAPQIAQLAAEHGPFQPTLFDQRNLLELRSEHFPGERLIVCRNPLLAEERARKRGELLAATEADLAKIAAATQRKRNPLRGEQAIALRVGRVIERFHMSKHIELSIADAAFSWRRRDDSIAREAALDGLYVIRTSVGAQQLDAAAAVAAYKSLSHVERAFRSMKTVDLHVRPVFHYSADRVRAHVFLCMLAYYVEWHMREAWRPLLFADEDLDAKATRDAVAPAQRSAAALRKASTHRLEDGSPAHSFRTLLEELACVVRNTCRTQGGDLDTPSFQIVTTPNATQRRALELLQSITV